MGIINITTTGVTITPYIKGQVPEIEKMTSVYEKITHKWNPVSGFISRDGNGSFLTYKINESTLKKWFPDYKLISIPPYGKSFDNDIRMKEGFELRQNQLDIINELIGTNRKEIFLNIPTATGKTVLGVWYTVYLHQKTLIMCFSNKILQQWEEALLQFTNAKEDNIVKLTGDYLEKIYSDEVDMRKVDIFLATPNVFSIFVNKHGYLELSEIMMKMNLGLKIFDEAHRSLGMIVKLNALTSSRKTLYMSADFNRGSRYARNAFFNVFSHCYKISLDDNELEKLKHIVGIIVNYDSNPADVDITKIRRGSYKWSHTEYAKYQFNNDILWSKCVKIINKIYDSEPKTTPRYKILVLCYLIDHVDAITSALSELYAGKMSVGRYHSNVSPDEKKEALNCDIIVSIYGSFSTGINVISPEIKHVISTVPVDEVTINQSAGRCRPINGQMSFLWVLCDEGFEYCIHNRSRISRYLVKSKIKTIIERKIEEI